MSKLFIIGAGFSKPAGLPVGDELFKEILYEVKKTILYEDILKYDILKYLEYEKRVNDKVIDEENIIFEDFISFLDIEHFLGLQGKDTWSENGNKSQILIRNYISKILNDKVSSIKNEELYLEFASKLNHGDYIITFNYDNIIEKALNKIHKNYRLFQTRFKTISRFGGIVEDRKEVVILKMHGSIDWFDIIQYKNSFENSVDNYSYYEPKHFIFNNYDEFRPKKIVEGPYFKDSSLLNIYSIENLNLYFQKFPLVIESPLIISPSHSKMIYLNPLKEFWFGLNHFGYHSDTVAIIGFSLPAHDDYIRQPLYNIIDNFQNYNEDSDFIKKTNLKIVDYKINDIGIKEFKSNYSFIDWSKTDCDFNGFSKESLNMIFT